METDNYWDELPIDIQLYIFRIRDMTNHRLHFLPTLKLLRRPYLWPREQSHTENKDVCHSRIRRMWSHLKRTELTISKYREDIEHLQKVVERFGRYRLECQSDKECYHTHKWSLSCGELNRKRILLVELQSKPIRAFYADDK